MALTPEDGTGLVDADSYASVAYADAYHAARGNTAWAALTTSAKEIALRNGTAYIDANYSFLGQKNTQAQALQWPRYGAYIDNFLWPSDELPPDLLKAACEMALRASAGPVQSDVASEVVKRSKVDVIEEEYFQPRNGGQPIYSAVDSLLRRLVGMGRGQFRLNRI